MQVAPSLRTARTRGQALVELALIAPILILLLMGAIDLGRVWYAEITIANAAREGAMEAAQNPDSYQAGQPCHVDDNRVVCRAINEAAGSGVTVTPADVTMTCDAACVPGTAFAPNFAEVTVEGEFSLITPLMAPFLGGQTITLSSTASATIAMAPTNSGASTPTPTPSPTPTPAPSGTPVPSGVPTPTPTPSPTPTPAPPPCAAPDASFTVNPASLTGIRNTTTFQFTDTSTNMSNPACGRIWSWNFGDGAGASSAQNPTKVWTNRGTYLVTLVVSNSQGSDTHSVTVRICNNSNPSTCG